MNKFMVLVVEDDKLIQNLMSTTLDIHNYRYLTASTATDALLLRVKGRQFEEGVAFSAPSPIDVEVIFILIAVANECMSTAS